MHNLALQLTGEIDKSKGHPPRMSFSYLTILIDDLMLYRPHNSSVTPS
jgi:hypothetical protein